MDNKIIVSDYLIAKSNEASNNFLIPNGTFFVILCIFLITFTSIKLIVVPIVSEVLVNRKNILQKTTSDKQKSAAKLVAAQANFDRLMAYAHTKALSIYDESHTTGCALLDTKHNKTNTETGNIICQAEELIISSLTKSLPDIELSINNLSKMLASKILNIDISLLGS